MSGPDGWDASESDRAWNEAQASAREVRYWLDRTAFDPTTSVPVEHVERICRFIEDIGEE